MGYTRNSDLSYYEEHPRATNCGSYALRLNEWYNLDDKFVLYVGDIYDWIDEMAENGYSDWEISTMFGEKLIQEMMYEFGDELEICDGEIPDDDSIELIAFSTYCYSGASTDYDFHFKVFRDGVWKEKCGRQFVNECDIDDWGEYIGDIFYLYHKIGA